MMKKIIIKDEIFELFPEFYRGIVLVKDISNLKSNKRIRKILKKEIERQVDIDELKDPRILAWNEAHRRFGSDPDTYLPSTTHLLKSMRPNRALPFINSLVALFNYISLKYLTPCGGDDVDRVEGNLALGISDGTASRNSPYLLRHYERCTMTIFKNFFVPLKRENHMDSVLNVFTYGSLMFHEVWLKVVEAPTRMSMPDCMVTEGQR